tara:strand:- start:1085 stop:2185 length:1101 start_codon:yes stop_codon:yes gene_type:complete
MINDKLIAVVVPCFNEESQISIVIETMPDFVDRIIIVNDNSDDRTQEIVMGFIKNDNSKKKYIKYFPNKIVENKFNKAEILLQEKVKAEISNFSESKIINRNEDSDRIIIINNKKNLGVGSSIARGYKWCRDHEIDCVAVMAGDAQMDPSELRSICLPVIKDSVDYVKGNRLRHPSASFFIPKVRLVGNSLLSALTKISSGYWRISDTQTGYTAISLNALKAIKIYDIYSSYGMPNDLLVKLNIESLTLKEINIKPVYGVGEQSKMKIFKLIPRVSWLLLKSFFVRLWKKYLIKDFHPLFLFYHIGILLFIISVPYTIKVFSSFLYGTTLSYEPLFAFIFLFLGSFQFTMFAMWMDILDNEKLYKD